MTEYDVRSELEFYGGDGDRAVNGLMRWCNMSLEDAVDSVKASGGRVRAEYIAMLRASLEKTKRADPSEPGTGSRSGS